jgi:hypothetical protein
MAGGQETISKLNVTARHQCSGLLGRHTKAICSLQSMHSCHCQAVLTLCCSVSGSHPHALCGLFQMSLLAATQLLPHLGQQGSPLQAHQI